MSTDSPSNEQTVSNATQIVESSNPLQDYSVEPTIIITLKETVSEFAEVPTIKPVVQQITTPGPLESPTTQGEDTTPTQQSSVTEGTTDSGISGAPIIQSEDTIPTQQPSVTEGTTDPGISGVPFIEPVEPDSIVPKGEWFPPIWSENTAPVQGPSPSEELPSKPEQSEFSDAQDEATLIQQPSAEPPYAGSPAAAWEMPSYQQQPPVLPAPKQPGKLAQPLPLWALIGSIALTVIFFLVLHLTGSDWAAGAAKASSAALILGIILVVALVVRTRDGMSSPLNPTRRKQYLTSIVCILVLFAYSGVGQILQPGLHVAQGHWFEDRQNWRDAINEYTLGGEKAPDAEDLARAYTSWGLTLSNAHFYNDAIDKFGIVVSRFSSSTNSATIRHVSRAQEGDIHARIALGQQKMQAQDYASAITVFDDSSRLSYCDSACLNQMHGDMAKALLGRGQQVRTTACSSAIPIYQRLVKEYSDTSDAKTAQNDLDAPQDVTGKFVNTTSATKFSQIGLVQSLKGGISSDEVFSKWDNTPYKTAIQNDGKFVIKAVRQGRYDLIWYAEDSTTRHLQFGYNKITLEPTDVAQVGPLCPVDVGTISNFTLTPSS